MATAQTTSRTAGRPSWIARTIITVVSLGAFAIAVLMSIRMFGCVQGIEFSPDTFQSRTFVYYEIPLIRVRVTGVYRDDISGGLQGTVKGLAPSSTIKPPNTPRWDLVAMTKGNAHYQDDALIVFRYLQSYNHLMANSANPMLGESSAAGFWMDWTREHDKLAETLWTAIAEVCRQDLYTFAPELFAQAEQLTTGESEPSIEKFEQALDEVLAEQYTQLGDVRRGQGAHAEAIHLYTSAIDHVADYRGALSGREQSYYNSGESDKSKQDRVRLRALEKGSP